MTGDAGDDKSKAAGNPPKQDAAGGGQLPDGGEKVFSQADVDRIIGERLTREQAKFSDYDTLKTQATELQKLKDDQKSNEQKLQDAATKAQQERDQALQRSQTRVIKSAFFAEAAKAGVAHPEDVYALADLSKVSLDKDDNPVGVEESVQAVVKAGRVPLAQQRAPGLDGGAGSGKKPDPATLSDEERAVALKMGITPEKYAESKAAIGKKK